MSIYKLRQHKIVDAGRIVSYTIHRVSDLLHLSLYEYLISVLLSR